MLLPQSLSPNSFGILLSIFSSIPSVRPELQKVRIVGPVLQVQGFGGYGTQAFAMFYSAGIRAKYELKFQRPAPP